MKTFNEFIGEAKLSKTQIARIHGEEAFHNGCDLADNPYPDNTPENKAWDEGMEHEQTANNSRVTRPYRT